MPMLQLTQEEKPIIWQPFKCPRGQALEGLGKRTLGARIRGSTQSVATVKRFVEDDAKPPEVIDEATVASHKLEVVVDYDVSCKLREHQRIGVQFLFDCLMGLKDSSPTRRAGRGRADFNGCGCILADDMGLGKTLQSVAAIWTLLTQGGPYGRGCCRKALELDKWLHGKCKYHACAVTGQAQVAGTFGSFKYDRDSRVLIASYETFRNHAREVEDCGIDLVVCDEAHKLKNDEAATTKCISALPAKRRLLISGTPIQNSLEEFFTLVSLANPGVFGELSEFRRKFANPILRGREPTATREERQKAEERCRAMRRRLYRSFLKSNVARKLLEDQNCKLTGSVLSTIKKLQGLVNHPFLVRSAQQKLEAGFDDDETRAMFEEIDRMDKSLRARGAEKPVREELSGKLALDRIVLISNWTQTLDLIERLCAQCKWPTHRLDGSMAIMKRMKLVTDFNRPENEHAFAFLLILPQHPLMDLLRGHLCCAVAGVGFAVNYLPVKKFDTGDGIFFCAAMSIGILSVGLWTGMFLTSDGFPAFEPLAALGGAVWMLGNLMCPQIIQMIGLGLGLTMWDLSNMLVGWLIGRFGLFGLEKDVVHEPMLNLMGLILAALSLVFFFVSSVLNVSPAQDARGPSCEPREPEAPIKPEDEESMRYGQQASKVEPEPLGLPRVERVQSWMSEMVHPRAGPSSCLEDGAKDEKADLSLPVPQEEEVLEDDLSTWSHHPGTEGVKDEILQAAAKELSTLRTWTRGWASPKVPLGGVSFTMGCHIEYTTLGAKEQIAKLEAEERAEQERRKAKSDEALQAKAKAKAETKETEAKAKAAVQAAPTPVRAASKGVVEVPGATTSASSSSRVRTSQPGDEKREKAENQERVKVPKVAVTSPEAGTAVRTSGQEVQSDRERAAQVAKAARAALEAQAKQAKQAIHPKAVEAHQRVEGPPGLLRTAASAAVSAGTSPSCGRSAAAQAAAAGRAHSRASAVIQVSDPREVLARERPSEQERAEEQATKRPRVAAEGEQNLRRSKRLAQR
eukprot:g18721.t2